VFALENDSMESDCSLCAEHLSGARTLYQDAHVFVLVNIEPVHPWHVMVLPVRHARELGDLTPDEAQAFLRAADRCIQLFNQKTEDHALCLVNSGKYRSQAHLHAHVLPSSESLRGLFSRALGIPFREQVDDARMQEMVAALRALFAE